MAVAAPDLDPELIVSELALKPEVFKHDSVDQRSMEERLELVILQERALVKRKVGAANWASTDTETKQLLRTGLLHRCCARVLQQVANIISYAPEHVIAEVADLGTIEGSIARYDSQADEYLAPYFTSADEEPYVVFELGTTGVDERASDQRMPAVWPREGEDDDLDEQFLED